MNYTYVTYNGHLYRCTPNQLNRLITIGCITGDVDAAIRRSASKPMDSQGMLIVLDQFNVQDFYDLKNSLGISFDGS